MQVAKGATRQRRAQYNRAILPEASSYSFWDFGFSFRVKRLRVLRALGVVRVRVWGIRVSRFCCDDLGA